MFIFKKVERKPRAVEEAVMQDIVNLLFMDGPAIIIMGDCVPDDIGLLRDAGYVHVDTRTLKKELKKASRATRSDTIRVRSLDTNSLVRS